MDINELDLSDLQQRIRDRFNETDLLLKDGWVRITCTPSSMIAAIASEVVYDFLQEYAN